MDFFFNIEDLNNFEFLEEYILFNEDSEFLHVFYETNNIQIENVLNKIYGLNYMLKNSKKIILEKYNKISVKLEENFNIKEQLYDIYYYYNIV